MFKNAKVVMLPTNYKKAPILSYLNDKSLQYFTNEYWSNSDLTKRHIYIISDEEIKVGDWVYNKLLNSIIKVSLINGCIIEYTLNNYFKVIATTDKSLGVKLLEPHKDKYGDIRYNEFSNSLPQPSQSFIEKYIQSYNKGQQIVDVLVEYEEELTFDGNADKYASLKVSKDNTITIKKLKDSWSRKEVIEIVSKLLRAEKDSIVLNNWIEQNL